MQLKPLPDFKQFRRNCRLLGAMVLVLFWMYVATLDPDLIILWVFAGFIYCLILFGLQSVTLSGDGAPNLPMEAYAVYVLAMGLGVLDTGMTWAWGESLTIIFGSFGWSLPWWREYFGVALLIGFLVGWLINVFAGRVLPRFEFLRLILWMHGFGYALMLFTLLYGKWGDWQLKDAEAQVTLRQVGVLGMYGVLTLGLWSVAPAAYLWFYRNYRARLNITETAIDEDDVEAIFPLENHNPHLDHASRQPS